MESPGIWTAIPRCTGSISNFSRLWHAAGILIGVASKNDEDIVTQAFQRWTDCLF